MPREARGQYDPIKCVLELAITLWESHNGLLLHFHKRLRRGRTVTKPYLQKLMLHAAIGFDYESNPA